MFNFVDHRNIMKFHKSPLPFFKSIEFYKWFLHCIEMRFMAMNYSCVKSNNNVPPHQRLEFFFVQTGDTEFSGESRQLLIQWVPL